MTPVTASPLPVLDQLVEVDGLHLRVRTTGTADGTPVLVLHGLMGHAREWDTLAEALAPHLPVVAMDQRGHGRSDWAQDYSVATMAGDAAAVVEALGWRRVHVLGHSMGGMVGMTLAAARPDLVERLVLVDVGPEIVALPGAVDGLCATLEHFASVAYPDEGAAVDEWMAGDAFAREELMAHYVRHNLQPRPDGGLVWRFDARGLTAFPRGTRAEDLWAAVDAVVAPTLLVRGAGSPWLSRAHAEQVVQRLADGRLAEVADGGHDLGVQRPEAVAASALDFLAPAVVSA